MNELNQYANNYQNFAQNCASGSLVGSSSTLSGSYYNWPYQSYSYPVYVGPTYTTQIRKLDNGFVVLHNNKEYCFNKIEELNKFLLKELAVK